MFQCNFLYSGSKYERANAQKAQKHIQSALKAGDLLKREMHMKRAHDIIVFPIAYDIQRRSSGLHKNVINLDGNTRSMSIDHNMKSFGGRDYDEPEPPQQFQSFASIVALTSSLCCSFVPFGNNLVEKKHALTKNESQSAC